MKTFQVIAISLGILLMTGCGDQVWCGENGCGASRASSPSTTIKI